MKELLVGGLGLALVALLGVVVHQNYFRFHKPQITTRYQAVTLIGGEVVYGRIAHLGSDHPVVRDAFSIRTEADPAGGPPREVLVRRRDGGTGADHVIVPATSIVSVEPVQPGSRIGRLIVQAGLPQ
jgi:hypothetical protein